MKIITLLTDFSRDSSYVAQMKAVILRIIENVNIVDISHSVTPQAVEEGAFILATSLLYFPKGSIHVGVVDPGVGTNRRGIIVKTKHHILVGPDNGLLIPAARRLGNFEVYEISNKRYMLKKISHTFHGRDVFAPVAAYIAKGVPIEKIGEKIENFVDLNLFSEVIFSSSRLSGRVVYIDNFGNIITNIEASKLLNKKKFDEEVKITLGKRKHKLRLVKSYGFAKKGEPLITIGSNGFIEISINQGNAAKKMGVKKGEKCTIHLN
ncbi:MAG: hypothetical protein DRN16_00875 [Thermoplasmata archaeon]|nr:MAG: hypothetical protein DRN16_00875 [Thermoplasmata archaeon]